jgi:YHS domain-containing protein
MNGPTMVIDPICGMTVQAATAAGLYEYHGKTYYFCATRCLEKFLSDPNYYLTPPEQRLPKPAPVSAGGTIKYVCPMDPEVLETKPGACPVCGMALEPRTVTVEEVNPELEDMTRRFWPERSSRFAHSHADDFRYASGASIAGACFWKSLGAGDTDCTLDRSAAVRAGLGFDRQSPSQHVYSNRPLSTIY